MKSIFILLSLMFLASCTLMQDKTTSSVPQDVMVKENESMMKQDESMMTGTWTKEGMDAMQKDNMMMGTGDAMMKQDDSMMKDDKMMKKETGYQVYSPELVASALKSGQKVALFFHATWCPSCKALDNTIANTFSTIPSDALIVKVDYDEYTDLKQKYGIVSQHTTVQLSADGTEKSRKLGARSVAEIFE